MTTPTISIKKTLSWLQPGGDLIQPNGSTTSRTCSKRPALLKLFSKKKQQEGTSTVRQEVSYILGIESATALGVVCLFYL